VSVRKRRDRQADGRTDARPVALRLPLDAASVIINCSRPIHFENIFENILPACLVELGRRNLNRAGRVAGSRHALRGRLMVIRRNEWSTFSHQYYTRSTGRRTNCPHSRPVDVGLVSLRTLVRYEPADRLRGSTLEKV